MKTNWQCVAVLAACTLNLLLTGCGGGGGGNDDAAGGSSNDGSGNLAPQSVAGKSVRLEEAGRTTQEVRFAATGSSYLQFAAGTTNQTSTGSYVYNASGNNATLSLTDSSDNVTTTYNLSFASQTAGSYTFTTSAGGSGSGTF
ncbi:MAG: hypothetical protein AB1813_21615, partial [Verrucomicrobiota bacterium]